MQPGHLPRDGNRPEVGTGPPRERQCRNREGGVAEEVEGPPHTDSQRVHRCLNILDREGWIDQDSAPIGFLMLERAAVVALGAGDR
jgi:hypothetical protein